MEISFDINDRTCEHRRFRQVPYHTKGGSWGTMYDDDIAYRDVNVCALTGTECISDYKFDCPRYANAIALLKAKENK